MKQSRASIRSDRDPVERYLSPAHLWEASEILSALADRLSRTDGVWAEDAREDADQVRVLAETLRAWCPAPPPIRGSLLGGPAHQAHLNHGNDWAQVLTIYLG